VWIIPPSLSSPCVPAAADSTSALEWQCQMLESSVSWRGKHIPSRYWRRVCKTNSWMQRLAGLISPPLLANRGVESWIASLVATRASHFRQPESGSESKTQGTCGPTLPGSSERLRLSGASSRTSGDISASDLSKCGETFADLVTRLKQDYSVRRKSVRHISENGSTSLLGANHVNLRAWPTPQTYDVGTPRPGRAVVDSHHSYRVNLKDIVPLWPTPRASPNENRSTKPTPSQEKGKHGRYLASEVQRRWGRPTANCVDMDTLERNSFSRDALKEMKDAGTPYQTQTTGMLNPAWVSLLMGYPETWTDIAGPLDQGPSNTTTSHQGSPETALIEQIA